MMAHARSPPPTPEGVVEAERLDQRSMGVVTQFAAIHCLHRRRQRRRTCRHRRCGDDGGGVRGVGERWDGMKAGGG